MDSIASPLASHSLTHSLIHSGAHVLSTFSVKFGWSGGGRWSTETVHSIGDDDDLTDFLSRVSLIRERTSEHIAVIVPLKNGNATFI